MAKIEQTDIKYSCYHCGIGYWVARDKPEPDGPIFCSTVWEAEYNSYSAISDIIEWNGSYESCKNKTNDSQSIMDVINRPIKRFNVWLRL